MPLIVIYPPELPRMGLRGPEALSEWRVIRPKGYEFPERRFGAFSE